MPVAEPRRYGHGHRIAVMQPYLFPYLGYFQLIRHVDTFVFLDDVRFIKRGFIHRNFLRLDGRAQRFTLPVKSMSQNRNINEHFFTEDTRKLIALFHAAYRKAPFFDQIMPRVEQVILQDDRNVARLAARSVRMVCDYLNLETAFAYSSDLQLDPALRGQDRIIAICRESRAHSYTNAIGGRELYAQQDFSAAGLSLEFIRSTADSAVCELFPCPTQLSVIDALMLYPPQQLVEMLDAYDTI